MPLSEIHKRDIGHIHPGLLVDKLGMHAAFTARGGDRIANTEMPALRQEIFEGAEKYFNERGRLAAYGEYLKEWQRKAQAWDDANRALMCTAKLESRLAIGLSQAALMQTGITLHHTYGVPIIPGSSVKGTCRDQAREEGRGDQQNQDKEAPPQLSPLTKAIYGPDSSAHGGRTTDGGEGDIVFFDALPLSPLGLELDILTPHHTKYYAEQGEFSDFYKEAPDTEEPVPVLFLTVPAGTKYLFVFLSRSGNGDHLKAVGQHWEEACKQGFGAKTSRGYGWFTTN